MKKLTSRPGSPVHVANAITAFRIVMAPVFLFLLVTADGMKTDVTTVTVFLWIIYLLIELSDLLDGFVARRMGQVTDLGKIFDPFADSLSRLTGFLGFTLIGLVPVWVFVIILYRDMWVSFMRTLLAKQGIALGARISGKIKAWAYAIANVAGLLAFTVKKGLIFFSYYDIFQFLCSICFYAAAGIALLSGLDYSRAFFTGKLTKDTLKKTRNRKKTKEKVK